MGGDATETRIKDQMKNLAVTTANTVNIPSVRTTNNIWDVGQRIRSKTPKIRCRFKTLQKLSPEIEVLLDSGASFSCIDASTVLMLRNNGFPVPLIPTSRSPPTNASSSTMEILGDVILDFITVNDDKRMECKNTRFSVFQHLSIPAILGVEVLELLGFKMISKRVFIGGTQIRCLALDEFLMPCDVRDAITVNTNGRLTTVVNLRPKTDEVKYHQEVPPGDYLISLVQPFGNGSTFKSYFDTNVFDACLIHSTELQGGMNFHFDEDIPRLPKTILVKLEKVEKEKNTRIEQCNLLNKSTKKE